MRTWNELTEKEKAEKEKFYKMAMSAIKEIEEDYSKEKESTITVTEKELELLNFIQTKQNEMGHSEFTSKQAKSKKNAGIISSLEKKDLIYDSYASVEDDEFNGKRFKMWCLTEKSIDFVDKPKNWY